MLVNLKDKKDSIVRLISKNMEGIEGKFTKIMIKLSIIKLVMAIVTLTVMTVLLFTHLHVFDPITLHFSRWVTSPIICFIMLVVAIKFVGLSIGLALILMSIKKITYESVRLRLTGYCKLGLYNLLRKKVQHQVVWNIVDTNYTNQYKGCRY